MRPLIIIQARLGSTRLPGKVLMPICGRPMLQYLMERMEQRVVAIPRGDKDGPLGQWLASFTGRPVVTPDSAPIISEEDVAGRFRGALEYLGHPPAFIRLCGDSPLMDPALLAAAIALYEPPYLEIRSPVGCVEVCDTVAFLAELPSMSAHEREHVTLRLRPAGRSIVVGGGDRLVVDTPEDFQRVKFVIEKMDRPHTEYGWRECVSLL